MKQKLKLAIQALIGIITQKILGSHVFALIVKSENGLFAVDPQDFLVGGKLRMDGKYGLEEIEKIKHHITLDSRVLFVGAHIGTLVIPISKLCKKVVAIEANPDTYELLERNIALNSVSNCQAFNIAASDKYENIEFLLSKANSGGSKRVPIHKKLMYYYDNPIMISIKAVPLDTYLEEKNFDVVIIDIEGSEYFALKGMQEIISYANTLIVEFTPHHLKNVSGVTVEEFLSLIEMHYSKLTIPSKQIVLRGSEIVECLNEMYNNGQGDDGIIFEKI